jgi:hypothetical protein
MLCSSCKNKTSMERCRSPSLKNLSFCGKHAKTKTPRLWAVINSGSDKAIKIQKIWRGWIVRHILALAGPGVLKRSVCHNTEDLVTLEEKVYPCDYFAFEEDGKIFWFDIRSLFQMSIDKLQPENPYTRSKLTLETRKRLKEAIYYRESRNLLLFHDPLYLTDINKLFEMRWMMISQMLEEHLFVDINPMFFVSLNRTQLWEFTAMLRNSILLWAREHKNVNSRRNIYYVWISTCWKRQTLEIATSKQVCHYLGGTLLKILKDMKQPHDLCFKLLSARYSL